MTDTSHLNALQTRLSHERVRLANAKTAGEREMRTVWVAGIEKEIATELVFMKKNAEPTPTLDEILLSDDELLAELRS